jgi:hypothetical protein
MFLFRPNRTASDVFPYEVKKSLLGPLCPGLFRLGMLPSRWKNGPRKTEIELEYRSSGGAGVSSSQGLMKKGLNFGWG